MNTTNIHQRLYDEHQRRNGLRTVTRKPKTHSLGTPVTDSFIRYSNREWDKSWFYGTQLWKQVLETMLEDEDGVFEGNLIDIYHTLFSIHDCLIKEVIGLEDKTDALVQHMGDVIACHGFEIPTKEQLPKGIVGFFLVKQEEQEEASEG